MSIIMESNNIGVEVQVPSFPILPPTDDLSDFEDGTEWVVLLTDRILLLLILLS